MKLNVTKNGYKRKPKKVWEVNKALVRATVDVTPEEIRDKILLGHAFTPAELSLPVHYLNKDGKEVNLEITKEKWDTASLVPKDKIDDDDLEKEYKYKRDLTVSDAMYPFTIRIYIWEIGHKRLYRRNNRSWTSQQIFGLDIDNEDFEKDSNNKTIKENGKQKPFKSKDYLSPKEALERCKLYGIEPFFMYHTSSSEPDKWDKFRLLFKLEEPTKDYRVFKLIQTTLMNMFPECDKQCKDPARLFYGSYSPDNKKQIYFNENATIDIKILLNSYEAYLKTKAANFSRDLTNYYNNISVKFDNGQPAIFNSLTEAQQAYPDAEITNVIGKHIVFTRDVFEVQYGAAKITNANGKVKHVANNNLKFNNKGNKDFTTKNWMQMQKECQLYQDFVEGKVLKHDQLLGLYGNLLHIKNGAEQIETVMETYKEGYLNYGDGYKYTCYKQHMKKWKPYFQTCKIFCPYNMNGECKCIGRMIDKGLLPTGKIDILRQNFQYSTLNKEATFLENEVKAILNRPAKPEFDITVIKAPTGFGKTHCYINNVKHGDLIIAPTHKLALEIKQKLEALNKQVFYYDGKPELADEADRNEMNRLYAMGFPHEANKYYRRKADEYEIEFVKNFGNINLIPNYLKKRKVRLWVANSNKKNINNLITIATHARLQYLDINNYNNIIVDEDILNTLFQQGDIRIKDLVLVRDLFAAAIHNWGNNIITERAEYRYANVDRTNSRVARLKRFILKHDNKCLSIEEIIQTNKHLQGREHILQILHALEASAIKGKNKVYQDIYNKILIIEKQLKNTFEWKTDTITVKFTNLELDTIKNMLFKYNTKLEANLVNFFYYLNKKEMNYIYTKGKNEKEGTYSYIMAYDEIIKPNKKYIIFSATISKLIYETLYKDITIIETQRILNKGRIIQILQNTSRAKVNASIKVSELAKQQDLSPEAAWMWVESDLFQLKHKIQGRTIITFLTMKDKFKEFGLNVHPDIHFGNSSGYNDLSGEDIVVYGTPHMNAIKYLLIAKQLGFDVEDTTIKHRIVERNGYRFWFATFDSLELQEIQMNLIETELLQAIGRARVLREECEVLVFSDFPIPDAEIWMREKKKIKEGNDIITKDLLINTITGVETENVIDTMDDIEMDDASYVFIAPENTHQTHSSPVQNKTIADIFKNNRELKNISQIAEDFFGGQ